LPRGFVRIRHFGLLANRTGADLRRCQELLAADQETTATPEPEAEPGPSGDHHSTQRACPECDGTLVLVMTLVRQPARFNLYALWMDSS
jgi:hypothetical protein